MNWVKTTSNKIPGQSIAYGFKKHLTANVLDGSEDDVLLNDAAADVSSLRSYSKEDKISAMPKSEMNIESLSSYLLANDLLI